MNDGLNPEELDAATRPITSARGLPARAYTSSEWARMERDSLLGRTWTCLGFTDDIPAGHALPIDLLGLPLLAVCAADGTLRVFHNVCRHRGHRLVDSPRALRGGMVCPYHAWTYGFDGALRKTPHIGGDGIHEVDGFDRGQHGLFEVRTATWLNMVFVNLSGDAPAFGDYIAPLTRRWEAFTGAGELDRLVAERPTGPSDLEVSANWKLAVENYCESYHLPFIHPSLNSYSRISDHYNIMAGDWGAGQGSTVFNYAERSGNAFPPIPHWPAEKRTHAEYIALYPNVLLGLQVDHAFAMILRPLAEDRTHESVRLYFTDESALGDRYAAAREGLLRDWMSIFAEDIAVVEGMQRGRASTAFDGGAFSPFHDHPTHHFHSWVARRTAWQPQEVRESVA